MSNILTTNANPRTVAAETRPARVLRFAGPRLPLARTPRLTLRKRFRWKGGWNEHRTTG
jgi:hypothetical protein